MLRLGLGLEVYVEIKLFLPTVPMSYVVLGTSTVVALTVPCFEGNHYRD
jgi:hypothetical protein